MGTSESFGRSTTPAASAPAALLAFDHVTKRRLNGRQPHLVLDGVSFDIAPGECVGLRGPRRSGKTTLLRIAAGIDLPDDGQVRWQGSDAVGRRRASPLRKVAFVAQTSDWRGAPGKPMLDHIALPLLIAGRPVAEALATARAISAELGAEDYVDLPPHLLPADVLARLSLARGLVRNPKLLIADAAGDDAVDGEHLAFQQLLACVRARPGLALLVASREASALRGTDRIMTLDGSGRLRVPDRADARVFPFPAGAPEP
ncbi:ATP-binding cassette domain-containing protein [Conexibacter arvalis]|uniref:Putative ABC transport system ATP-binding protein n=1 Tax=Conexibacter arvalis TaxID=912552 RepID=A0A840II71_9ACTN|nr:ATP-binding cassette domain-containing protein [Conexibacter arvalis]MBB4664767.1 putative ABC transport system ATP-binding protein [Conexibacter arvalis]